MTQTYYYCDLKTSRLIKNKTHYFMTFFSDQKIKFFLDFLPSY